ncbi:MAG: glycosyltransferase family 4 protein [Patescibacteria group bacterium]
MTNTRQSINKLKIGLVLDDSLDRNDGVQQYVRALGGWLTKQGHTVHYLAGQSKPNHEAVYSLSRNVNIRFNGNRLTVPLPANSSDIKVLLANEKYDVLHVQMPYSPMMAGKVIKSAAPETAVVGTFHILPFGRLQKYGSRALGLVQKRQLKRLDAICSVSPAAQQFAKSHFGLVSSVIPNMIDTAAWQTNIQPVPGRIVFLGRLVPRKGCKQLLKALASLPEPLGNTIEVLIAGDGPERQKLQEFANSHNLTQVKFMGYVDEHAKADLLASAVVAVFPSLGGESFGIVLIEAMAAGAGVVLGGDNPGYKSVLGEDSGALIQPTHTGSFAQKLELFLTDNLLNEKIHNQQKQLVQQYDIDTVGPQILNMYQTAKPQINTN